MNAFSYPRVTPWVWRLIVANAVALLLLLTLFPSLQGALAFYPAPAAAVRAPWTFVTYMFVHAGLLHLAFNMLLLYFLGSEVERRMGGRQFLLFYTYCGVGGAVLSLALAAIAPGPIVGASAAVLGVAVAFALYAPDAEMVIFPLPFPIKARTFVIAILAIDVVAALLFPNDGVAHIAHLGGALFGYLYFRIQVLARRGPAPAGRQVERAILVPSGSRETGRPSPAPPAPAPRRRRSEPDAMTVEMDRVLDKISEQGMGSLTAEERHFLQEMSKRKKDELH